MFGGLAATDYLGRFRVVYRRLSDGEVEIVSPEGGSHRIRREADSRIVTALANGSREIRQYDRHGRCTGRVQWREGQAAAARWRSYRYTPEGELRRVSDSAGDTVEYRYDAAHRLTERLIYPTGWAAAEVESLFQSVSLDDLGAAATTLATPELPTTAAFDPEATLRNRRHPAGPASAVEMLNPSQEPAASGSTWFPSPSGRRWPEGSDEGGERASAPEASIGASPAPGAPALAPTGSAPLAPQAEHPAMAEPGPAEPAFDPEATVRRRVAPPRQAGPGTATPDPQPPAPFDPEATVRGTIPATPVGLGPSPSGRGVGVRAEAAGVSNSATGTSGHFADSLASPTGGAEDAAGLATADFWGEFPGSIACPPSPAPDLAQAFDPNATVRVPRKLAERPQPDRNPVLQDTAPPAPPQGQPEPQPFDPDATACRPILAWAAGGAVPQIHAETPVIPEQPGRRRWAYDPAGNLLGTRFHPNIQLQEGNRLAGSAVAEFRYNHRNHLVEQHNLDGTGVRYYYNALDLLVRVEWSDRAEIWTAEYDGLCRRIAKTYGTARTEYWWDGDRPAAERAPDGRLRIYVYPNEEAYLPLLFVDYASSDAPPESGTPYYLCLDQVGLPETIENGQGEVVWRAEDRDPYGWIEVAAGNTLEYDLRFPGHYFDPETGLHYNRFRYYDPRLGRYLQSDPKGQAGGVNLYGYSGNPLGVVDVLGLDHTSTSNRSAVDRLETELARHPPRNIRDFLSEEDPWSSNLSDLDLQEDAYGIHDAFPDPNSSDSAQRIAHNAVTIATAELYRVVNGVWERRLVYTVSRNRAAGLTAHGRRPGSEYSRLHAAATECDVDYERVVGRTTTDQTDAEQVLLNWAADQRPPFTRGRVASSRPACTGGPRTGSQATNLGQDCAGRLDEHPGIELISPRSHNLYQVDESGGRYTNLSLASE